MILAALIFIPILAAVAIAAGAPARLTSLTAAFVNLLLTGLTIVTFDPTLPGLQSTGTVLTLFSQPDLKLSVGVDGLSLVMVILTALVTLAAVMASPARVTRGSLKGYYASVLLIAAGAMGAFVSTDLFFFFSFHELALIPTFLMIGIFGTGDRRAAAWKITIYLGLGSLVLLAGLSALFIALGGTTFDIGAMTVAAKSAAIASSTQSWIFLTLLIGFGVLISLFPFHSWAPSAYACAPTPVAMLHAGVLKKFGLYGLVMANGTAELAQMVFPTAAWAEKRGSMVNATGRLQRLGNATEPPGQAKDDWEALRDLTQAITGSNGLYFVEDVFKAMAAEIAEFSGLSLGKIGSQGVALLPAAESIPLLTREADRKAKGVIAG